MMARVLVFSRSHIIENTHTLLLPENIQCISRRWRRWGLVRKQHAFSASSLWASLETKASCFSEEFQPTSFLSELEFGTMASHPSSSSGGNSSSAWTSKQNKLFEKAIAIYDKDTADQCLPPSTNQLVDFSGNYGNQAIYGIKL
ncbi:hypothetical protein SUGI_0353360 [Cryptomeria japonica]|nr:hypothetical protein SUGI_0353360 [Cryptomeria japonica]